MKLSICLPTFNRSKLVIDQLKFIKSEFKEFEDEIEVLVSDNCSDSDSKVELIDFSKKNNFFDLFLQESNLGLMGNTEFLLKESTGDYIWFVGDDDIIKKGIAKRLFTIFKDHPNIFYVFFNHHCFKNNITNIVKSFCLDSVAGYINNGTTQMFEILKKHGTISMFMTSNVYKRTNLLEKNKNLNRPLEIVDFLWFSFISANSGPMYVVPEIYIHDNLTETSWSSSSRKIFGTIIPLKIIEFNYLLKHNVDISKELQHYYKSGRGHFLIMFLNSNINQKIKIIGFLGLKNSFKLLSYSICIILSKILYRA